jgi:uncharacterized membrane protein YraQ (UPF0718 family)
MDLFTIILYGAAGAGLIASFVKSRKKTLTALKKAWKAFENILPQFLSVLVIIGLMLAVLKPETISKFVGSGSGFLGMLVLAALGAVTLIPGFIAFPLAASLLKSGAGFMQIAVFISTLMMVGVVTLPVEFKYFGKKAAIIRNSLAFLLSFGIAAVIGVALG